MRVSPSYGIARRRRSSSSGETGNETKATSTRSSRHAPGGARRGPVEVVEGEGQRDPVRLVAVERREDALPPVHATEHGMPRTSMPGPRCVRAGGMMAGWSHIPLTRSLRTHASSTSRCAVSGWPSTRRGAGSRATGPTCSDNATHSTSSASTPGRGRGITRPVALRTLLVGVPTRECHGWGEPVHAPLDGVVVAVADGIPERRPDPSPAGDRARAQDRPHVPADRADTSASRDRQPRHPPLRRRLRGVRPPDDRLGHGGRRSGCPGRRRARSGGPHRVTRRPPTSTSS